MNYRVATVQRHLRSRPRCAFRAAGQGTAQSPLRLLAVLRHSGMGDEASIDEAQAQVESIADAMAGAFGAGEPASRIESALLAGHAYAQSSNGYYSAGIVLLTEQSCVAAGIGDVLIQAGSDTLVMPMVHERVANVLTRSLMAGVPPPVVDIRSGHLAPGESLRIAVGGGETRLSDTADLFQQAPRAALLVVCERLPDE